jgi:hypothetical protein
MRKETDPENPPSSLCPAPGISGIDIGSPISRMPYKILDQNCIRISIRNMEVYQKMHHAKSVDFAAQVVLISWLCTFTVQGAEIPSNGRPIKSL